MAPAAPGLATAPTLAEAPCSLVNLLMKALWLWAMRACRSWLTGSLFLERKPSTQ